MLEKEQIIAVWIRKELKKKRKEKKGKEKKWAFSEAYNMWRGKIWEEKKRNLNYFRMSMKYFIKHCERVNIDIKGFIPI